MIARILADEISPLPPSSNLVNAHILVYAGVCEHGFITFILVPRATRLNL